MSDIANTPAKGRSEVVRPEATRGGGAHFTPRVDIVETEHELTLYAEVPGVKAEDVDLHYENGELVLQGRVARHGRRNLLLQEYEEGNFYRVFTVHESIDARRIAAECKNGVLTVHLPKTEAVKPRQISVKGG